jgi:hypothetical protein
VGLNGEVSKGKREWNGAKQGKMLGGRRKWPIKWSEAGTEPGAACDSSGCSARGGS